MSSPGIKYTLQYFHQPGSPGEVCRLLLTVGEFDWTDDAKAPQDWGALKGATKYGGMPVLTTSDGKELTQSRPIARYLAALITLDGEPLLHADPWLAFQVDEYIEALADVRAQIFATFSIKDNDAFRTGMFATDGSGSIFEGFKKIELQLAAGSSATWAYGLATDGTGSIFEGF
ncbi:hypothetical protein T484DRAFT_1804093 [Baffinella frigidus]|nr:hypothetical protein T484DRAFT_1804093 [Cryptophyta sp. CCMP2293]